MDYLNPLDVSSGPQQQTGPQLVTSQSERVDTEIVSILRDINTHVKALATNTPEKINPLATPEAHPGGGPGLPNNPISKLEKLSEEQLAELQKINKSLEKQIEQADLAADAARRETKDEKWTPGASFHKPKKDEKEKEGFWGGIWKGMLEKMVKDARYTQVYKNGSFEVFKKI